MHTMHMVCDFLRLMCEFGRGGGFEGLPRQQQQQRWQPDLKPLGEYHADHVHGEEGVVGEARPASRSVPRGDCQFFAYI